jgi:hypothetical protein
MICNSRSQEVSPSFTYKEAFGADEVVALNILEAI